MADDTKPFNQNGYLMLNGPDDTLWIPRSSNKSWLTLFYALPREMVEERKDVFPDHPPGRRSHPHHLVHEGQ